MSNLCIIAEDRQAIEELCQALSRAGYSCSIVSGAKEVTTDAGEAPALVLLEDSDCSRLGGVARRIKGERALPIIALLHGETISNIDGHIAAVDDFIVKPWNLEELELRIKRLLRRTSNADSDELIKCGDLVIDVSRYEVFVSGRPVALTFKEYELLKFLASNNDRVFTREALLNKVWGYDYYGGDRTVDVHIKRLRSKIEGSSHTLIETVRNIGYRLRTE